MGRKKDVDIDCDLINHWYMNSKLHRFCVRVGPGGIHCPCCRKGSLSTAKHASRRGIRRMGRDEITLGLSDYYADPAGDFFDLECADRASWDDYFDNYDDCDDEPYDRSRIVAETDAALEDDLYLYEDSDWYDDCTYVPYWA